MPDLQKLDPKTIRPFPGQPRTHFDQEELRALAESIREVGQQAPISVRALARPENGFRYELIDGERRLRACKLIKLRSITAVVRKSGGKERQFAESVASNFCRAEHTVMESALALERMIAGFNHVGHDEESRNQKIERAARICGRTPEWVYQLLALLNLNADVRRHLNEKKISTQVAYALSILKPDLQVKCAERIIGDELDHAHALAFIRKKREGGGRRHGVPKRPPSEGYNRLRSFVQMTRDKFDILLDMPPKQFAHLFTNQNHSDVVEFSREVVDVAENLNGLAIQLRKIAAKKAKQ